MLPLYPPSLLALMLLQGAPGAKPFSTSACEDNPRIELSREPTAGVREVCVSPGSVTGFLFDAPFSVELPDELLATVQRGESGISLSPPRDLPPGERLRLTARLGEGESQRSITFMLVVRPGQATRQVEVFQGRRTGESYEQELEQERAKNQKLREENQELRTRLLRLVGLRGLFVEGILDWGGIAFNKIKLRPSAEAQPSNDAPVKAAGCESYRSGDRVAVGLNLRNLGTEPWILEGASLMRMSGTGAEVKGLKLGPVDVIAPQEQRRVAVELDALPANQREEFTLVLRDTRGRTLSLSPISFP